MEKILKCGPAEGTVNTLGGELTSYKVNGKEYIWYGDAEYWNGHAPVLFPFVSALKDGKVIIDGKECHMEKKHGIARKSEFAPAYSDDSSASFVFASSPKTKELYPYDFELTVKHEIAEKGFKTTYSVKNTDSKPIQFCIGGHPGFCTGGSIEDWQLVFDKDEDCALYYTDEKSLYSEDYKIARRLTTVFDLKYDDFDVDALVAPGVKSRKVKLVRRDNGKGMEFDFTGFNVLVLWSPPKKKAPFVALEPWNGLPAYTDESGNFADKPYVITLPAGETYSVGYSLKIID